MAKVPPDNSIMAKTPTTTLTPISANPRFAAASAIMVRLTAGLSALDREIDALRIEQHLGTLGAESARTLRNQDLRERLDRHRAASPKEKPKPQAAPAADDLPAPVVVALEALDAGARARRSEKLAELEYLRAGARAEVDLLEADRVVVQRAIVAQQEVLDRLRDELSAQVAEHRKAAKRERVLAVFRAAQQFAGAIDAERDFDRESAEAGYTPRPDLLPTITLRSALVLGSERFFDSEISRVRRLLEEMKAL